MYTVLVGGVRWCEWSTRKALMVTTVGSDDLLVSMQQKCVPAILSSIECFLRRELMVVGFVIADAKKKVKPKEVESKERKETKQRLNASKGAKKKEAASAGGWGTRRR
jgi:hypothetical protein